LTNPANLTTTTDYVAGVYEKAGADSRTYYILGGQRVAVKEIATGVTKLYWTLKDHLGSTVGMVRKTLPGGSLSFESPRAYSPYGEALGGGTAEPGRYHYTGQREYADLGLYFYNARWFDPAIQRFVQADTLIPDYNDLKMWDRYSYVQNNPLKYIDPSGKRSCITEDGRTCLIDVIAQEAKDRLKEIERKLNAMATFAESHNGSDPSGAKQLVARTLLNRKASKKWSQYKQDELWAIVLDTAFSELLGEPNFPLPDSYDPKTGHWHSLQDMYDWVEDAWSRAINGKNAEGYESSYDAVVNAEQENSSNIIYFSHQKNSEGDFNSVEDRVNWILRTSSLRKEQDTDFNFQFFGPFDTGGETVFLVASSDPACGFYGTCGPPWPSMPR
jgi:RHS repeat-associated protein